MNLAVVVPIIVDGFEHKGGQRAVLVPMFIMAIVNLVLLVAHLRVRCRRIRRPPRIREHGTKLQLIPGQPEQKALELYVKLSQFLDRRGWGRLLRRRWPQQSWQQVWVQVLVGAAVFRGYWGAEPLVEKLRGEWNNYMRVWVEAQKEEEKRQLREEKRRRQEKRRRRQKRERQKLMEQLHCWQGIVLCVSFIIYHIFRLCVDDVTEWAEGLAIGLRCLAIIGYLIRIFCKDTSPCHKYSLATGSTLSLAAGFFSLLGIVTLLPG